MSNTGILLTNTGTPDQPTTAAVRRYLREFLSDKRIVQLPRLIWLPILYGLVLPSRPKKSAALYQKIWTKDGSPMRTFMANISDKLQRYLGDNTIVTVGMNYGNPSISAGLTYLQRQDVDKIIVLPLFPQYSHTSTASTFDRVTNANVLKITSYADNADYINALATSVKQAWQMQGQQEHLLISFHGIPERFVAAGDPYESQCQTTAHLLAQTLALNPDQWTLCYQSQFGYDKWLKPSTQQLFLNLPQKGIKRINVICPGFSVDCLETLEEIAISGQEAFHTAGGEYLGYVPALNDSDVQVEMLAKMIQSI
jgi:ferrochelatase